MRILKVTGLSLHDDVVVPAIVRAEPGFPGNNTELIVIDLDDDVKVGVGPTRIVQPGNTWVNFVQPGLEGE